MIQGRLRTLALASILAGGLVAAAASAGEVSADADASKPFIVKIHADWCGTCTRLNGTWEALEKSVGSEARLVVLDVTDKEALARSRAEADRLGLRSFFDAYKSQTGTVAVLDGATREPVSVMKGELDAGRYEAAVARAQRS